MKRHDAYVPAVEPAPVTATPARPAPTADSVSAKWRDNLGAWIGVTVLLSAGYALLRIGAANVGIVPLPGAEHSAWSFGVFTLIGGVAFGWLMAWRSSLDERERQGEIDGMVARIEDDAEYIEQLEEKVTEYRSLYENAVRDLAESRAALHQAMGRNSDKYRAPEEETVTASVERDAQFLLQLMYSGQPAGWQSVTGKYNDWNRKKWEAARDLLEAAGCISTVGNQTKPSELTHQAAVSKLGAYCHSEWDS